MTTLQKIVKEAKRLKKLHPNKFPKWTDYVKAASKTIKKTGSKKVADVNVTYRSPKDADYIVERRRNGKFKGMLRVAGTRTKKKPATHTDKGSHNVKIKVVSGAKTDVNKFYIAQLSLLNNEVLNTKNYIEELKKRLPTYKTKEGKAFFRAALKEQKNKLILLKHQIMMIKRNIK